jgi:hypothetical protein
MRSHRADSLPPASIAESSIPGQKLNQNFVEWGKNPREFVHKAGNRLFFPKEDFSDHLMEH